MNTRRFNLIHTATILLLGLSLAVVVAEDAATPTLSLAASDDWGQHLVTADGMSVYLYVLDEGGTIACVDACTNNWRPVVVDSGSEPTVGEGLDQELIGTIERTDGSLQVTFGGWPLYTFARDTQPGHARGQGLGQQFYLLSTAGTAVTEKLEEVAVEVDADTLAALMSAGGQTFSSHCAVCHGAAGQGGIGPTLAGNSILADRTFVIRRILEGFAEHGMPPFAAALDDQQVASVATFIRGSWGNEFSPVLAEEVMPLR